MKAVIRKLLMWVVYLLYVAVLFFGVVIDMGYSPTIQKALIVAFFFVPLAALVHYSFK